MPTAGDQVPGGPTDFSRRLQALEQEVRELRAARRLEAASVGKGGLSIRSGGRFAMATPTNVRMIDVGAIDDPAFNHSDGSPQQAMFFRREDGTNFLVCYAYPPSGSETQAWTWYDRSGNVVFAEDTNSAKGLARPYIPIPMGPDFGGGWDYWPRTSGTGTVPLWSGAFYKQLPRLSIVVQASMDTSGATGQLEMTVQGQVTGPAQSVGFVAGWFTFTADVSGYDHMQQLDVVIRGRRTAGTGTLRAGLNSAYQN
ncbi:hypothetical protein PV620_30305 [Streptomyces sp. ME02-6978a]|uniref:hypothetical protein n=1 Tax=unclassified Streptomyces TaxID=2593676 RepID=UPI0029B0ED75|nr:MULTISPECIES: hypothetical protein [unclassified Streptomyces]MDX3087199.1 hypothetical protein [Streptomyces sp. ME12-02E]MDX3335841.1 hypothetical protein [Streptomyces sp. ME02-6978a]